MSVRWGLAAGAVLLTAGLVGCAGPDDGENGGIASAGGAASPAAAAAAGGGDQDTAMKYSRCMRENGVPSWPDPVVDGEGRPTFDVPDDIPDSVIGAGAEKCREYRPFGPRGGAGPDPARITQLREFAKCMRANGLPEWPDPEADGSQRVDFGKVGVSGENDPKLKAAEEKCRALRPSAPAGAQQRTGS